MSAGNGLSRSSMGSVGSSDCVGLSSSLQDGSDLSWKVFRREVLLPHRIRLLDTPPNRPLPETLISLIEANRKISGKFQSQKEMFRNQVVRGRGLGPSPLFPPNLLPSIDGEPCLSRCMSPSLGREALPPRMSGSTGPLYELSVPQPALGCGFTAAAFSKEEIEVFPSWLFATGTVVHFESGYVSTGTAAYCPFLTFERAHGIQEQCLETAKNRCAVGGALSTRAVQMLYANAWGSENPGLPQSPISFSCAIDNDFAIINYHWINISQEYCMSPLCKFNLKNDRQFTEFLVWIESISMWGVTALLPCIKRALSAIAQSTPVDAGPRFLPKLIVRPGNEGDKIMTGLRTAFVDIPWRFEDEEYTPVSSSTASWGSPINTDVFFPPSKIHSTPPLRSIHTESETSSPVLLKNTPFPEKTNILSSKQFGPTAISPPPAYVETTEPDLQHRLDQALANVNQLESEIQSLRHELGESRVSTQNELAWMKNTLSCVLRKEKSAAGRLLPRLQSQNTTIRTIPAMDEHAGNDHSLFTSPTDPQASRIWRGKSTSSGLQTVTSFDELSSAQLETSTNKDQNNQVPTTCSNEPDEVEQESGIESNSEIRTKDSPSQSLHLLKSFVLIPGSQTTTSVVSSVAIRVLLLSAVADFAFSGLITSVSTEIWGSISTMWRS